MSFAKKVKEELSTLSRPQDEQLAELAAFFHLNVELEIRNQKKSLWFKTTNATVARRFLTLAKNLYQIDSTLMTAQEHNFQTKNTIYVGIEEKVDVILSEHDMINDQVSVEMLTKTTETKTAYLRGCFLISGSVNNPKTAEYHLEIYSDNAQKIIFIQRLINEFGLNAKIIQRRKGYIVYLKEAEAIADFLRYIGALETVFQYDDIRIKRDFNNSINRVMNCEIANERKIIEASEEQINDIELILSLGNQEVLNEKLKQTIFIRKEYPELSLQELAYQYEKHFNETITKSGLNHRLKKIKEIADQIRGGEYIDH